MTEVLQIPQHGIEVLGVGHGHREKVGMTLELLTIIRFRFLSNEFEMSPPNRESFGI